MIAHRRLSKKWLLGICSVLAALNAPTGASLADSIFWNVDKTNRAQPRQFLAQHIEIAPSMPRTSIPTPPPRLTPATPTQPFTSPVPPPNMGVPNSPGGSSPELGMRSVQVVPACMVTSGSDIPSANCTYRFISIDDLFNDFYSCLSAACYAKRFLDLDRAPIIVIYPSAPAARAEAREQLRAVMISGIRAMGAGLEQRASDGDAGLPSISQIDSAVKSAIDAVDAIDQPVNESPDERLRRLGLTPDLRSLATRAQQ
jgi:hypothetical protein